ncbi:hypothetical protein BOX15_Mlig007117g3 [Macrostomum lignano]|uniref:Tumor necrosis factor alpha-induced protein 8-like protein n=2 Tax=Macrostomum lignano TaxID=282301 RepID=A0A267H7X1_9PLAT|nr:hypothetical protein BOX15_Mlig007117g3 [Macrostomum lignano]
MSAGSEFSVSAVSLKAQKKLASRFSTRKCARVVLDDLASGLLDRLHKLVSLCLNSRKDADKTVKNLIKVAVKAALLAKNEQFNDAELAIGRQLNARLRHLLMTLISFHRVDFTYDRQHLIGLLNEFRDLLDRLLGDHVTQKSHDRLADAFQCLTKPELLDELYGGATPGSRVHSEMQLLCRDADLFLEQRWSA